MNFRRVLAAAVKGAAVAISAEEEREGKKNPIAVIDNYDSFTYNICQV